MRHIRAVVFDPDDAKAILKAQRLIDIAYPPESDPLVPRDRAAADNHPMRSILRSVGQPYDVVTVGKLVDARKALEKLLEQVTIETSVDHWLSVAGDPSAAQAKQMAAVLAAERTGQLRHVREAIAVVDEALMGLDEKDDVRKVREDRYADI